MTKTKTLFLLVLFYCQAYSQSTLVVDGKITFITEGTVYIKFPNTTLINSGDTLFIKNAETTKYIPTLMVIAKSTTTCVASRFAGMAFNDGQVIYSFQRPVSNKQKEISPVALLPQKKEILKDTIQNNNKIRQAPNIHGRFSLSSSNNFSSSNNLKGSRQVASLVIEGSNIANSRFTAETNISYSSIQPSSVSDFSGTQNMLRIYGLSTKYKFKSEGQIIFGRAYNYNLSSIGSIDGLQIEKGRKNFIAGIILGYRPDLFNYTFNTEYLQFGAYVGHHFNKGDYSSNSSLGFIDQRNHLNPDRKYATIQHSGNYKKIRLFGSSEVELYNPYLNKLRLTSLYASINFNITKKSAFMLSYDTRKTIVYYETYNTELDRYLANDIAMNGLRFRWNMQWLKNVGSSFSSGLRYQSNGENKSSNYNASIFWNEIPFVYVNITISHNSNSTNSILTQMNSINLSKYFISKKIEISAYWRHQEYQYTKWTDTHIENEYLGGSINLNLGHQISIITYYDYSIIDNQKYHRINLNLIKRF